MLTYGREAVLPIDIAINRPALTVDNPAAEERVKRLHDVWTKARGNMQLAQDRQAKYANQHRRAVTFAVGDQVLLSTAHLHLAGMKNRTPKFSHKFIGPFKIIRVVNDNAYELELPPNLQAKHSTFNITYLKPYKDGRAAFPDRPEPHPRPPPEAELRDNGEQVYEVDRILGQRGSQRTRSYLVLWKGYPIEEATWEPYRNLGGASEAIREFRSSMERAES